MQIDGETSPDIWEPIWSVPLDTATTETITITNAQDYVDSNGYISLRARWVGGASINDSHIFEIWRVNPIGSFGDELALDFGGLGLWDYDGTNWTYISGSSDSICGWSGGLALDFGVPGVYNYDGTNWDFISVSSPEGMTGWSGGLAMDFDNIGAGLYNYDGTNWNYITSGVKDMDDVDLY